MASPAEQIDPLDGVDVPPAWTVDELARLVGLPVRTLRDYQSSGILPAPRREGRVGWYGPSHLRRLQLIADLRERGYSLAGIGDLLGNWSAGADLGEVLGLEPDQLVHIDEPGAPATMDQIRELLPAMVPSHLAELEAAGVIEPLDAHRVCVPSPSLLQLAVDAIDAGVTPDGVAELLGTIRTAANAVADQVVEQIGRLPDDGDLDTTAAFLQRGRGLLAHGVGRLTLHQIGRRLGIDDEADLEPAIRRAAKKIGDAS